MTDPVPETAAIVIKVGGSLFDWPLLGPRLRLLLETLETPAVLLVPGGGATADVVRGFDQPHALGEETAHWLALRALTFNAHFLAALFPPAQAVVVEAVGACAALWRENRVPIMDAYPFALADEGRPGCLPHTWEVTSDSIALRLAVACGARQLLLLKSVTIAPDLAWGEAGRRGLVDACFARALSEGAAGIEVRAVNLRTWTAIQPGDRPAAAP